jgi:hypothetical protein
MTLAGKIGASSVMLTGGDDADNFLLTGSFGGSLVFVNGGKGNDQFGISPTAMPAGQSATLAPSTHASTQASTQAAPAATLELNAITLDGGDGDDIYSIQFGRLSQPIRIRDTGVGGSDRATVIGTDVAESFMVSNNVPNGRSPQTGGFVTSPVGQQVDYSQTLETLTVNGRGGSDVFQVQPSQTAALTIDGGSTATGVVDTLRFDSLGNPVTHTGSQLLTAGGRPHAFLPVLVKNIDMTPPIATVNRLAAISTSRTISLQITLADPSIIIGEPVSGVATYDLFVSVDSGVWTKAASQVPVTQRMIDFTAAAGHRYAFRAVATDRAGNVETEPSIPVAEATTTTSDFEPPVTSVTSVTTDPRTGIMQVNVTGRDSGGSGLREIRVLVSVDGESPVEIPGSPILEAPASPDQVYVASLPYQGIRDDIQHSYRFTTLGVDYKGNAERGRLTMSGITYHQTFPRPVAPATGINVQHGQTQRSFVNAVDVLFSDPNGLQSLIDHHGIRVERFGIHTKTPTIGTGRAVTAFHASQHGKSVDLDFPGGGLGGNGSAGNGFYRISLDLDGDGQYDDQHFEFFRLFGDKNGNGKVQANDQTSIREDLNGDRRINTGDRNTAQRQLGKKIDTSLYKFLDD